MYHNPELYKHLKAATKESSGLLKSLAYKLQFVKPTQETSAWELKQGIEEELRSIVKDILPNEPSFKLCVEHMSKEEELSKDIEKIVGEVLQKWVEENGEKSEEETREMLLKWVEDEVGINESLEEDAGGLLQRWAKSLIKKKAEGNVLRRIGEYLNCPSLRKWEDFREFNEQAFDEYYIEYEQFLYSNLPLKYQIVASLENFNYPLPSPDIILSGNTRIVSNRDKHIDGFNSSSGTYYKDVIDEYEGEHLAEQEHYNSQFISNFWLEIDCEIEKGKVPSECIEYIEHLSMEEVKRVFHILRLYKEGDFRHGVIYWRPNTPYEPPYDEKFNFCTFDRYDTSNKYLLQKDDIKEIQLVFQKYTNNRNKKLFPHSSIYYLDKGVREEDTADQLVNYTAALESLFVDGKEGIATLLAHRVAFFLEEDRHKCKSIYKDVKKAYAFRSNIVHGNRFKIKDELELKEYCKKIEEYVRQAITKWIDMVDKGMNRQEIYDLIEENLFT